MEHYLQTDAEEIRLSNSPRRSPQITHALTSPITSVHPLMQQMDSMHGQMDLGLRNTDYFDDETSDEGSPRAPANYEEVMSDGLLEGRSISRKKGFSDLTNEPVASQCEGKGALRPSSDGYQRLTPTIPPEDNRFTARTPSSSLIGSVDELLPGPRSSPPSMPQRARQVSNRGFRTSERIEPTPDRASRLDPTLSAYAIAHDITLQALMRDEFALDKQSFPLAPLQIRDRSSLPPASLRLDSDPRGPRDRHISSPPETKKVHLIPPPIDTSAPRRSLPANLVRTPFPFSPEHAHPRSTALDAVHGSVSATISNPESTLTLSICQSNKNSRRRVTTLTIPATNDFRALRSNSTKEQHFRALEFDDAALFKSLRKSYLQLAGPWAVFSARSLRRIIVKGNAMKEIDRNYWIHRPQSPRLRASKDLLDIFGEERIMQYYRKPSLGKSRYAFVQWAHRLAAAPPATRSNSQPKEDEASAESDQEQSEGLEFVVSWSVTRISLALLLVIAVSVAAALLWIFLGRNSTPAGSVGHGGFRDAGDRVTAGVVMGICLLLLGISGIGGWLGVSWLVM